MLGEEALQHAALLAGDVDFHRLAGGLELLGLTASRADDVGVERASEPTLRRRNDQQM
jgi:hypothetical protein